MYLRVQGDPQKTWIWAPREKENSELQLAGVKVGTLRMEQRDTAYSWISEDPDKQWRGLWLITETFCHRKKGKKFQHILRLPRDLEEIRAPLRTVWNKQTKFRFTVSWAVTQLVRYLSSRFTSRASDRFLNESRVGRAQFPRYICRSAYKQNLPLS